MIKRAYRYIKEQKIFYITTVVILSFLIFYHFSIFSRIDNELQDYIYQSPKFLFEVSRPVPADIIILGIDEESLQQMGRLSDWPRSIYATALDKIKEGKAAVIGVDILFTEVSASEADQALIDAVKRAGNVVIPSYGKLTDTAGTLTASGVYAAEINKPFRALSEVCIHAHINTIPDADGVVRKTINQIHSKEGILNSLGIEVYKQYAKSHSLPNQVEIFTKYEDAKKSSFFDYLGGPGTFSKISFAEVLEEDFPVEYFEGAIVLIGPYTEGMMDTYYTPISKNQAMYGIEIWANIIQNIMQGKNKRKVPTVDLLLIILFAIGAAYVFKRISPLKGIVILIFSNMGFLAISRWMYIQGIILSLIYAVLSTSILFLIILVIRYIEEFLERKRVTNIFGRYVAPQVVEQILQGGEEGIKLGGTKKIITVLFVDIRGFTSMSEKASPERVVEILNEYLNLCASAIVGEGGTLDKFIGDAAMAIFNAPLDLEEHALHAVRTALTMKRGALVLDKRLKEKYGCGVKFGIGIHTGDAVVGNIGCHFRMDYTAIGDTVNTAARLESNAKPDQILMSESTYNLVKDKVNINALGSIKIKGKEEKIKIFEVEGLINDF